MKIFDFKNPKHVQILKEEVTRAKRLIREYNENEMWKNMPTPLRRLALSSADDDMGPDFADEYEDAEWMNIPDTITNRIDLSNFALPKRVSSYKLAEWIKNNRTKIGNGVLYPDSNQSVDGVINFLERGNASQYYIAKVIAELIERGIRINFKDVAEDKPNDINITTGNITGIDPYSMPGGKPSRDYTGRKWTGD
jgi:hypothetical protein